MHYCKPIVDIVFAFVLRCFAEYERTIAILEKTVRRLQRGERRRPVVYSNFTAYVTRLNQGKMRGKHTSTESLYMFCLTYKTDMGILGL